jgi:hypothetical protein
MSVPGGTMQDSHYGFDSGQVVIELIKLLKQKGVLQEKEILDLLWDAKDPLFPWTKQEIKELIKL